MSLSAEYQILDLGECVAPDEGEDRVELVLALSATSQLVLDLPELLPVRLLQHLLPLHLLPQLLPQGPGVAAVHERLLIAHGPQAASVLLLVGEDITGPRPEAGGHLEAGHSGHLQAELVILHHWNVTDHNQLTLECFLRYILQQ